MSQQPTEDQMIGARLRWLRSQTTETGRSLAMKALGSTDAGLISRMEKGHSLSLGKIRAIARYLAGQGQLIDDDSVLFRFIVELDNVAMQDCLRPTLRLVNRGQADEATPVKGMRYSHAPRSDQRFSRPPNPSHGPNGPSTRVKVA